MNTSVSASDFDIVIAGGGMIGMSMALAIASLNLRIAVVERVQRDQLQQPSFDDRSTALSRSSQSMFQALGLWDEILSASTPIQSIHVSDRGKFGFAHITAKEQNVEALGYVVINRILGEVLMKHAEMHENVSFYCPAKVTSIEHQQEHSTVILDSGESLSCKLLIGADGTDSKVREYLGIGVTQTDYEQVAIIGNIVTEKPIMNRAYERFSESGPLALLPIQDNRTAFIWIVSNDEKKKLMKLGDDAFILAMQEVFGLRLGQFKHLGRRTSYPLLLSEVPRLYAKRGVIIGNAANALHPVAAQGFNLGLRDVATLADCISEVKHNHEIGDSNVLLRYSDWRYHDQKKLRMFTDGLVKLFGSKKKSVQILRDIGMVGFDLIPGFRKLFVRHTMGLTGKLPRLSRGIALK